MKRREILKISGLLGMAGITGVLAGSCINIDKTETATEPPHPPQSEKDKLITNRYKMSFQDPENPTEHELKHTPDIRLGEIDEGGFTKVDIMVGSQNIVHPTTDNHWIDYVKIFADDKLISDIIFEPGVSRGFAAIKVNLKSVKKIKAEIGCNIHGIWENSLDIQ